MEKFDRFVSIVFAVLKYLLTAMLAVMVVVLCVHVFFRYVLNNSLTWSEEFLKILLVWFGMLSVAVLAARREHVSITVFKAHMPKVLADLCSKFTQLLTVVVCAITICVGFRYAVSAGTRLTPALRIPYVYAFMAIPVSFILVTLFEVRNLLHDITKKGDFAAIEKPEDDLTGGEEFSMDLN